MTPISFFVHGEPKPQPRARSFVLRGKGGRPILTRSGQPILRVHEAGTAEYWKQQVALAAKLHAIIPLTGPLRVKIDFYFSRPKSHYRSNVLRLKSSAPLWHTSRGDVDNLFKAVTDALTTIGMWADDSQICDAHITKQYSETMPGAHIQIEQLSNPVGLETMAPTEGVLNLQ